MRTGEIAVVGETKADRKTLAGGFFQHRGGITHNTPTARAISISQGHRTSHHLGSIGRRRLLECQRLPKKRIPKKLSHNQPLEATPIILAPGFICAFIQLSDPATFTETSVNVRCTGFPSAAP